MSHTPSDKEPSTSPWQSPQERRTAPWSVPPGTAGEPLPQEAAAPLPPVTPVSRPKPVRWIVALLATVLVVVTGVGLAMLAMGSRTTPALGPTFLSPGTVAYMESRLDLPGDQRDNLITFMGRFPGFADPAAFDLKVNDTLDRLTREASQDRYTYTGDIEPWFDGEFALGVTELPDMSMDSGGLDGGSESIPPFVGALSVADRAALDGFLARLRAEAPGATFTETSHDSTTIVTYQPESGPEQAFSYAVTDESLLFALAPEHLVAALDVRSGAQPSLADSALFQERFASLPAERLGAVYLDLSGYRTLLEEGSDELDDSTAEMLSDALDQLPEAVAGSLRVEADRLVLDMLVSAGVDTPLPPSRSTSLAARMPSTSAFYAETRDVGEGISKVVEGLVDSLGAPPAQLDQIEAFLGVPVEDFLLWIEDTAVSVAVDGDQLTFGLAATVTDATVAAQRVERLTTAIRAASAFGEMPFTLDEEEIAGSLVTTIALKSPSTSLPDDMGFEPSLSYGIHEGIFYMGVGDFVSSAMQQSEAGSLAADPDYATALEAAGGATNSGVAYLDLAALRAFAEGLIPDEGRAEYDRDVRPYLEAFDRFIMSGSVTDGDMSLRALLYVE